LILNSDLNLKTAFNVEKCPMRKYKILKGIEFS